LGARSSLSSLLTDRGRGLFTSDDITALSRSAPKHLLWYSAK